MKLIPKYQEGTPKQGSFRFKTYDEMLEEAKQAQINATPTKSKKAQYNAEGDYYYGGKPFEVKVTGKARQRPYFVSSRTGQFTGNSVATPILRGLGYIGEGFNSILANLATSNGSSTGQYSVQSPQQAAANRRIQTEVKNTLNEYVWPTLMPSNYAAALSEGSLNPYRGAEIKAEWSPMQQLLTVPLDIWASKRIGQGVGRFGQSASRRFTTAEPSNRSQYVVSQPEVSRTYVSPNSETVELQLSDPIMGKRANETVRQEPVTTIQTPSKTLTNPRTLIETNEDGTQFISLENLQKLSEERLGRRLTESELYDYIGKPKYAMDDTETLGYPHFERDNPAKAGYEFEAGNLDELLQNFERFTKPDIIRTRYGNEPRYNIEDLVDENGRLRRNVALQRANPGSHGVENWNLKSDKDPFVRVNKYTRTKYGAKKSENGLDIKNDNPFDRSGVLIKGGNNDYSIDSFFSALKYLRIALGTGGRKFFGMKPSQKFIRSNDYGQLRRYNENFSPELIEILKENNGELPKDIKVGINKNTGTYILQGPDGTSIGTLTPRTNLEIINDYKPIIDQLNKRYNLNIAYPRVNVNSGEIEWPNIFGILYRKGGKFKDFMNK